MFQREIAKLKNIGGIQDIRTARRDFVIDALSQDSGGRHKLGIPVIGIVIQTIRRWASTR